MANALKGEASFEHGGRTYTIVMDINALCEAEDVLGMDVDAILARYSSGVSTKIVRGLFWGGLRRNHSLSIEEVGDIISDLGFLEAKAVLESALKAAMPEPAKEGGKNPPRRRGESKTP